MKENIVFIHGLTGNKRAFKKELEYFESKYHVHAYDLLGHGVDRGKPVDFTLEGLVRQLEELFEKEKLAQVHLCALSYGCYPAVIFAARRQNLVKSMCMIGGHFNAPSPLFDVFEHYWERRNEPYETWLKNYARDLYPKSGVLDVYSLLSMKLYVKFGLQLHENVLKQAIEHRLTYDLQSDLAKLKVPVLWVMGEHDVLFKSCLGRLTALIPHVAYKEILHAGHAANLFRPFHFRKLYEEFLASSSV